MNKEAYIWGKGETYMRKMSKEEVDALTPEGRSEIVAEGVCPICGDVILTYSSCNGEEGKWIEQCAGCGYVYGED